MLLRLPRPEVFLLLLLTFSAAAFGEEDKTIIMPDYRADKDVSNRNFEGANLELADFSGSNASGSSFVNANLDYANLSLANFQNTNLTNVTFKLALVEFTDFTGAEGLTAEQLYEACLMIEGNDLVLGVEGFDAQNYLQPEGCQLWEHMPRG
ncbi:MAG: Unknown protein [uncultured Thiotrichaceae bacterium]|uniref:Pentapeptide repeat-containing protein n=1 Tax=uncultured Thiotrichaceae bacterium TaxID=298394 RepID=A0A6S6UGJ5_9GAMM|nr:MAG: Unknown protein [uncultured Thiotrichaceae bacterium]